MENNYKITDVQVKYNHNSTRPERYVITGEVNGTRCKVYTNDSMLYDALNFPDVTEDWEIQEARAVAESNLIDEFENGGGDE